MLFRPDSSEIDSNEKMEFNSDEDTCNTTDMTNVENEQQEEEKELVRPLFENLFFFQKNSCL